MPTIPRYDGPQLQEQNMPNSRYSAAGAGNISEGGNAIARGLGAISAVVQDRADRETARIDAATVLEARRKLSDWERFTFDDPENPRAVSKVKGRDAAGLQEVVLPGFNKTRSEIEATLRTPAQKQAFAELSFQYEDRVKDRLNRHVATEADAYAKTEFNSALDLGVENITVAVKNNDPSRVASEMATGLQTIKLRSQLESWPPEQTELMSRQFESKAHASAVQQMISDGRYDEAEAYFSANAEDMTADDQARAAPTMREIRADRIALGFTDEIETGTENADARWGRMITQESGDNQFDKNGKPLESVIIRNGKRVPGAIGAAQVMPATAMEVAKKNGITWDEVKYKTDPVYNKRLGRLYFDAQIKKYGDPMLAAAAYNAGPGAVDKWLTSIGDPRNGEVSRSEFAAKIPFKETREYVAKTGGAGGASGPSVGRSFSEKLSEADKIPDPKIRASVKARVREQEQLRRDADQQKKADVIENIDRHLAGGGTMTNLPPDLRASAMAYAPNALLHYEGTDGAGGAARRTDQVKYYDLLKLATEQPLKFKDLNLKTQLPYLSDTDFQELAKAQAGIKSGRGSAVANQAKAIDAVAKPMLLSAGLMKQDGKSIVPRADSKEMIGKFYNELGGMVRSFRAETGKDPTVVELKGMSDRLLMKNAREEPGMLWGTNKVEKFAFEELPGEALSKLSPGRQTKFSNGQVWTLQGNKPVRIK